MTKPAAGIRLIVNWLLMILLVWFAVELVSFSGLELLDKLKGIRYEPVRFELTERSRHYVQVLIDDREGARSLSPTLGWTNTPNSGNKGKNDGDSRESKVRINSQGLRSTRDYPLDPVGDTVRILAFGDSFTFGAEVDGKDCWTACLSRFAPQVEVINFGVPGFALDQAFLRYGEEGKQFNARIVLIGFLTENIKRHVNVYRPFLYRDGLPAAKPRFRLDHGSLELIPNPLPSPAHYEELLEHEAEVIASLGTHDHFYRMDYREGRFDLLPSVRLAKVLSHNLRETRQTDSIELDGRYNTRSEAYQVTVNLFEQFAAEVTRDGAIPVAVIFPRRNDIKRFRDEQTKVYTPLLADLDRLGIEYVDLMDAFARAGRTHPVKDFLSPESHYSALGNLIVAHHLWQRLDGLELLDTERASEISNHD